MANYLDMMFSDPTLAKKLAAGPMDPNAFNSQLDTTGKLNSPSFAQALGTGAVTPAAPVEAVVGGAAAPAVPGTSSTPAARAASPAVNPAMLSALMAATKPTAQPHAPAAGSPAAGKGFTPLAAAGKQGGSVAPGFFKALYGK